MKSYFTGSSPTWPYPCLRPQRGWTWGTVSMNFSRRRYCPYISLFLISHHSSTFRGSMSSHASSAGGHDPTQRRLTLSNCLPFLSYTFQGSIRRGCTPGGTPLSFPTKSIIRHLNSGWGSSGRSTFRFTYTVSFERAWRFKWVLTQYCAGRSRILWTLICKEWTWADLHWTALTTSSLNSTCMRSVLHSRAA